MKPATLAPPIVLKKNTIITTSYGYPLVGTKIACLISKKSSKTKSFMQTRNIKENTMSLREGFDRLMMAISFAEAGEHEIARDIMKEKEQTRRVQRTAAVRKTVSPRKEQRPPSMHG